MKIKDCTKKQIYEAIYDYEKTSVGTENCQFCKYKSLGIFCDKICKKEYETCIDYESIIDIVGDEEIEVEDSE